MKESFPTPEEKAPDTPENIIPLPGEVEHIRESNRLQMELAKRLYTDNVGERFIEEWIPKYSKRFRELLEKEIAANSDFFDDCADPIKREEMLARFEDVLYNEESLPKAA